MAVVLSLLVLAVFALIGGAILLWRRGGSKKQVGLMCLAAAVLAANVLLWSLPYPSGNAPLGQELK